jgi:pimeloyl-ACP methyl ester carboxylesterase
VARATSVEMNAKPGTLEADGLRVHYLEAGSGEPVVVFPDRDGELFDSLLGKLAGRNRVIAFDLSAGGTITPRDVAAKLSQGLPRLGVDHYAVMGVAHGAALALAQAIAAPEQIDKLILLSPQFAQSVEAVANLAQVKAATLVLVGTRDASGSVEAGRLCREKIRVCHLLFVYDAGHAVTADRLEACINSIADFLDQGEQFIIFRESQMIRP